MIKLDWQYIKYPQEDYKHIAKNIYRAINTKRSKKLFAWCELPYNQQDIIQQIKSYAESQKHIENFIVLGIGGSALGALALHKALNHPYHNELHSAKRHHKPKFYVLDNVDPNTLNALLNNIDLHKTLFNVVSKSGNTIETLAQLSIIKQILKNKIGTNSNKHIVCCTENNDAPLATIAKQENYTIFNLSADVGGRFSVLSTVGLLPAVFCGIDIEQLLAGASAMDKLCHQDAEQNIALKYAILHYHKLKQGCNISIMMPYADSLKYLSDWYAQLWAESLGKKYDNIGNIVHVGQTPVKALGATDQHSQLQLYSEGPADKIFTFLTVENFDNDITLNDLGLNQLNFMNNISMSTLLNSEQQGSAQALAEQGRESINIIFSKVDAYNIGQFIYFMQLATIYMAELLNINALDQPGVEASKINTRAILQKINTQ